MQILRVLLLAKGIQLEFTNMDRCRKALIDAKILVTNF